MPRTEKQYPEWVQNYRTRGTTVKKRGDIYYLYFNDPLGIKALQEERPYIKSVGYSKQTRILKIEDNEGSKKYAEHT